MHSNGNTGLNGLNAALLRNPRKKKFITNAATFVCRNKTPKTGTSATSVLHIYTLVLLCLFSGFSINPPTASGCRMERLSHVTVFCLGRKSYLATWASLAWTRPLKMLSLWGMATLIIHFFISFPTFSLSFFHYTLISDICSSNATHWCLAG